MDHRRISASTSGTYGIQAAVRKPPFDPIGDVTPIIAMARAHPFIIVKPNGGAL